MLLDEHRARLHARSPPEPTLTERTPRAAGAPEHESTAAQQLLQLLDLSLGNPTVARAAVAHALGLAGRQELPTSPAELLSFVRAHLVSILTSELGPRLTMALLDDLEAKLDPAPVDSHVRALRQDAPPSSLPPSSRRREIAKLDFRPNHTPTPSALLGVLVIDPDRINRPVLARALLRARWSVTMVDSPAELAVTFASGESFGVALVRMDHPHADVMVSELTARFPSLVVVARCVDTTHAQAQLVAMGVAKFEVRSSDAPPEELVDAIRRTVGV
jgi:hypothetical protein